MSLPKPPVDLSGHCSVIHDDTLYVYTPDAFLSLPLKLDGEWSKLPMGESVSGAVCVKGGVDGNPNDPGIYVVGGIGGSDTYSGVQLYSFKNKKWMPLVLSDGNRDFRNRVHHAAAYITASSSILVFAGDQNGSLQPSTQTYLISAAPPYVAQSFNSDVVPTVGPLLLPWREDSALMVGGGDENTRMFTFSKAEGWRDTGVPLIKPLPDRSQVQCALLSGADGSKVLEVFDFSKSPNTVTRYVVLRAGGVPAGPGEEIGGSSSPPAKRQKRDIILSDFPKYNNKNAPTATRRGFSLAQDGNGKVVISGGSKKEPVAIFNQAKNSWVDTDQLFLGDDKKSKTSTIATTSSATATSTEFASSATLEPTFTPTPSTTALASPLDGGSSNRRTLTIVGATLGAILGFAALLIIILLLIGWRKRRNRYMKRGKEGYPEDKNRLSFQDQGMEPLTRSVQPMARGPVPSTDSWAMMAGQFDDKPSKPVSPNRPPPAFSALDKEKGRSPLRQIQTNNLPGESPLPGDDESIRGDRRTDEGWSKYFQSDNEPHVGRGSPRSSLSSLESKSDYRNSGWPTISSDGAPINLGQLAKPQSVGRVVSGSPSTETPPRLGDNLVIQQGMRAKISSGDSLSIASDDYEDDKVDAFSSGVPASINESTWAPIGSHFENERVASSTYSSSVYAPSNVTAKPERPLTQWPTNAPPAPLQPNKQGQKNMTSDMSWLNLGVHK
ncbi:hypothetical protein FQN53_004373 [Emmonsiellopsis sp. PD_33]|nr:hypothetical protein FQN53_004373 [Emmonsiellopsis sp. PD_33]